MKKKRKYTKKSPKWAGSSMVERGALNPKIEGSIPSPPAQIAVDCPYKIPPLIRISDNCVIHDYEFVRAMRNASRPFVPVKDMTPIVANTV
jgi:hypothetical protein